MSTKEPIRANILTSFIPFFEKALDVLPGPDKIIVVFLVTILLGIALQDGSSYRMSGLILLTIVVITSFFLKINKTQLRYSQRTENGLKEALRDEVFNRQKEMRLIETIEQFFFDDRELRELFQHFQVAYPACTIDYDSLGVQDKVAKVCGLVLYCYRHDAVDKLIETIHKLRPNASI